MEIKTQLISKTPGIQGRIKKKILDFKVKEINQLNETLELKAFTETEKIELKKKWDLIESEKEHLHLTMEKFNLDTITAIKIISRFCGVSRKRIGYAGLKDKRAITVQKISIWKPELNKVKNFTSRYIDLRDAEWKNERIELGYLKGNSFEITIRDIELTQQETNKRILNCFNEIKKGIPNYFGEQRFGGIRKITHKVGKEFLKGNSKKAVLMYLTETNEKEEKEIQEARKNLSKTLDFKKALQEFPKKYRFEKSILNHLIKNPNDYVNAFRKMPKSFCYLFTHAYQSYLFNEIINERIKSGHELNKIKGDKLIDGIPAIPLLGYESKISSGQAGEIEKKILEKEQINLNQFKIKEIPELSSRGTQKKMVLIPYELKLKSIQKDELNPEKIQATISFWLEKGNYATTVLNELMKNQE